MIKLMDLYIFKFFFVAICATIIISPLIFFYNTIIPFIFPKPLFIHKYANVLTLNPLQKRLLEMHVVFYKKLNPKNKIYFEHRMVRFLNYYQFESAHGLKITEEMKILIAASYIQLHFGKKAFLSRAFSKIILYPNTFYFGISNQKFVGAFNPKGNAVLFSWHHFKFGYENNTDNLNVGLHEFAHVLKHESLRSFDTTSNRFSNNLKKLKKMLQKTNKIERLVSENYLRKSAFYDNHEFFAVLVEHNFETPHLMKQKYPLLFRAVTRLLNYDDYLYALE